MSGPLEDDWLGDDRLDEDQLDDELLDDDRLVAELARVLRGADPVPATVVEAARGSFGWRELDAELAKLVADSRLATAPVRGDPGRLLSFQAGDRTLEIEVTRLDDRLRILGQVVPPGPARVRAEQPAGTMEVTADQLGRFTIDSLPPGPTRFFCLLLGPDGAPVDTGIVSEWQVL